MKKIDSVKQYKNITLDGLQFFKLEDVINDNKMQFSFGYGGWKSDGVDEKSIMQISDEHDFYLTKEDVKELIESLTDMFKQMK